MSAETSAAVRTAEAPGVEVNAAKVLMARKSDEREHAAGAPPRTGSEGDFPTKSPLSTEVSAGESEDDEPPHEDLAPELAAEAILKQGYLMKRGKTKRVRPSRDARAGSPTDQRSDRS